MTQEDFKRLIEAPTQQADDVVFAKYAVSRTARLVLQHPELAKEWYDNLTKVVSDKKKITFSNLM